MTAPQGPGPALVVGGGGALGRASALALAARGHRCVLAGPTEASLEETARLIAAAGGSAAIAAGDLGDQPGAERAFALCEERFGACRVLVHAAAIQGPTAPIEQIATAEWDEVLRVNLRSAFHCAARAVPPMVAAGGGSIVLISSADALRGFPLTTPYASSKAALIGFARALSAEVRERRIRVNVLSPGPIPAAAIYQEAITGIATHLGVEPDELMESVTGEAGGTRNFDPAQIARGVAFLAGPEAEIMTGQVLTMDSLPG